MIILVFQLIGGNGLSNVASHTIGKTRSGGALCRAILHRGTYFLSLIVDSNWFFLSIFKLGALIVMSETWQEAIKFLWPF